MQVRVRLFAMLRAREGADQIEIDLDDGASAAQLVDHFFATRPGLDSLRPHLRLGLNGVLVGRDANLSQIRVQPDDEIALLPPASGGSRGRRSVKITAAPLPNDAVEQLISEIATSADGAIVVFVGRTRISPGTPAPGEEATAAQFADERVLALEYEAAEPYALAEINDICERLIDDGLAGEGGIGVWHAVGSVPVGSISIITVVASPHRDRAYIVSRALIDSIKQDVPIWKAERYESGRVWNANRDALTKSS
jgi:molybdopterin synthase catalytic subunit